MLIAPLPGLYEIKNIIIPNVNLKSTYYNHFFYRTFESNIWNSSKCSYLKLCHQIGADDFNILQFVSSVPEYHSCY